MTLTLKPEEYERIMKNYPDRVPVFVTKAKTRHNNLPEITKKKFLAPSSLTVGEFIHVIRKWIKLKPEQALFVFIGNEIPSSGMTLYELHGLHKDLDGALRMTYAAENTFGFMDSRQASFSYASVAASS